MTAAKTLKIINMRPLSNGPRVHSVCTCIQTMGGCRNETLYEQPGIDITWKSDVVIVPIVPQSQPAAYPQHL